MKETYVEILKSLLIVQMAVGADRSYMEGWNEALEVAIEIYEQPE